AFLCSNGAFCTWAAASSSFSCVGGTGTVNEATSSSSAGPPASVCPEGTLHEGHWDCANGAFCEEVDGAWVCEGGGSACVVHGGHTHGDCSDQCNGVDLGEYDLDLHVVALFMVLVSSLIGVLLPLLCSKALHGTVFSAIFFGAKHFGTGVIISTAFVHLLYHAFIMFGNTCLGELAFEPAAAAIAMGAYLVFGIDFCVMRWLKTRGKSCASTLNEDEDEKRTTDLGHCHGPSRLVHTDYASPQAHADVTILEAGIIFHSIMIGVSLGASGGSQWVPLFIAVVFHQMFEGLALGSRIGQLVWTDGRGWKRWVMAGTFGLITPIGVAIGIGVHSAYNPNSGAALLSIGVLDSISAGILIYAGLVEMLAHDFMHGELSHARAPKVVAAFFFLLAGSLCMSVLGKWA
ncbi:Zip-domain-containing protein, partial [Rhodotorula diobovata]